MDLRSKTVLFGRTSDNLLVSHLLWFGFVSLAHRDRCSPCPKSADRRL